MPNSGKSRNLKLARGRNTGRDAYVVPQPFHDLPSRRPAQETRDEREPDSREDVTGDLQEDRRILEDEHGGGEKTRRVVNGGGETGLPLSRAACSIEGAMMSWIDC